MRKAIIVIAGVLIEGTWLYFGIIYSLQRWPFLSVPRYAVPHFVAVGLIALAFLILLSSMWKPFLPPD